MKPRKPTFVVLHCSDTPDNPSSQGYNTTMADIDKWHKAQGWKKIGYHWVIHRDGTPWIGRREDETGAHCKGHNAGSIGVCLIGRRVFTADQMDTLYSLYMQIKARHGIEAKNWYGHYELDKAGKTCPNLDMDEIRAKLEAL